MGEREVVTDLIFVTMVSRDLQLVFSLVFVWVLYL